MSEQDKDAGGNDTEVMVEAMKDKNQKAPFRPNELQDGNDGHHKRPTAPAIPSIAEKLKKVTGTAPVANEEIVAQNECERAVSLEKQKHIMAKKLSSNRRDTSPESIPMAPIETDKKKVAHPTKPIPTEVKPAVTASSEDILAKKGDDDSITEEVTDLRIPGAAKEHSEWSDDEEAGGLPRSVSRASRVSRVVRQMFCCGVSYEAPSEENIPALRRDYKHAI